MTPREIALVQASWLYARLFELEPSLKRLFKGDMQEKGRKVMAMISVAVNALTRLESVVPAVQALGQGLGASFTKEVENAWRAAYGVLAATMKEAANRKEEDHATAAS